ncbi:acyltransferase family protein, partial [uncultured Legionella sp.]|uniref:acyltransferase family protein n=1 Tax=uncultured Legionella sp. TaxID=210934 RepID=UPI00262502A9
MSAILVPTKRILSLDVFRGLTIVLMILVNSQGNQYAYPILEHAQWNGCTLADLVFPFFLFIVGLTSVISLNKSKGLHDKSEIYRGVFKRSILLFVLGLILNIFPHFTIDIHTIRVYGVLQRIAVCYLICSFIYLNTTIKAQSLIFLGILWGYWFVMTLVPVPGYGTNQLTMDASWVSYLDQLIFSKYHLLAKTYDPEGFFSTLPSVATTLSGVLTGSLLLHSMSSQKKCFVMFLVGGIFLLLGWIWDFSFPINKNLWSSSFVLWSSGLALITFAFCYLIIDIL